MTVMEAIAAIDNLKHNTYSFEDKVRWLSTLDGRVAVTIMNMPSWIGTGYDPKTDGEMMLLIPSPYDEIYLRWLEAQIDYANGEYSRYNNSIDVFNTVWAEYQNYYNRSVRQPKKKYRYF